MNSTRVKANEPSGCCGGFGTFQLTYPKELYQVMEPNEFETTIRTINKKCETKMPKSYLFMLIPIILGFILVCVGFYKISQTNLNDSSGSNPGPILVGIGMTLTILGCVVFSIAMCIFQRSVNKKIKQELEIVNDHYFSRRIKFTLESEVIEELVDKHEYDVHKNNKAYMNSITYDKHGRPMKKKTVYFILIVFPAPNSNQLNNFNNHVSMNDF